MSQSTVLVKEVKGLTRRRNTTNGNPTYDIHFTDGTTIRTRPDTMWSLEAENREYQRGPVEVHLDSRGLVRFLKAKR